MTVCSPTRTYLCVCQFQRFFVSIVDGQENHHLKRLMPPLVHEKKNIKNHDIFKTYNNIKWGIGKEGLLAKVLHPSSHLFYHSGDGRYQVNSPLIKYFLPRPLINFYTYL